MCAETIEPNAARTATLRAEEDSVVWLLDREAFANLRREDPEMIAALYTFVIRVQSERLAFATRQVEALQR